MWARAVAPFVHPDTPVGTCNLQNPSRYAAALRLETDPYDRSYILYNLGLCFAENGEYSKAAKYYMMAVDQNYELCSAWNNLGVIFHAQGVKAETDYRSERAEALFEKAAEYWNRAASCAPGTYTDAERWLVQTGRANGGWREDVMSFGGFRRVNDTAVIVRRQATKILSAFVLNHPDHPDVVPVTLDLLRRSTDSEALRNLVMGTFELLWFMDDEPTPEAARQLSRVVDASKSIACMGDVLTELLRRFRKTIGSKKNSKGYEFAIRRWTTLILNEFVQLKCKQPPVGKKTKGSAKEPHLSAEEQWLLRRSLLSTLEAFAAAQPKDLLVHLRPLTIYLALEDDSTAEEQWVAIKVCRILSTVLPYVAERRGLMDHRQVQVDLQALIRSQPSSGVHEAVRCLCLVVKYVTGDLGQIVTHMNVAVPSLTKLCSMGEELGTLEQIQVMYMSRQAWILASILESLSIDDYIHLEGVADQPRRVLPRSELKFELLSGSVAATVADILLRTMYGLGGAQLRAVAASCMGFFLKGQRSFTKDKRISELLAGSLSSGDLLLCRKGLETLSALLGHFRVEADKESKAGAVDFADSRDHRVAGKSKDPSETTTNSAIEAAQPLAAFADQALAHISLSGSVGPAAKPKKSRKRSASVAPPTPPTPTQEPAAAPEDRAEGVLRVRVEALAVVRHLHQQGLVNPMAVLPKARMAEPNCLVSLRNESKTGNPRNRRSLFGTPKKWEDHCGNPS
ncbi:unnamed protein product [Effrenium voratum]|nr:unnamed protein product [Effrenium voratum]